MLGVKFDYIKLELSMKFHNFDTLLVVTSISPNFLLEFILFYYL